jgi:hypothetical protein
MCCFFCCLSQVRRGKHNLGLSRSSKLMEECLFSSPFKSALLPRSPFCFKKCNQIATFKHLDEPRVLRFGEWKQSYSINLMVKRLVYARLMHKSASVSCCDGLSTKRRGGTNTGISRRALFRSFSRVWFIMLIPRFLKRWCALSLASRPSSTLSNSTARHAADFR